MPTTPRHTRRIHLLAASLALLAIVSALPAAAISHPRVISLRGQVAPDSFQLVFDVVQGDAQISTDELNDMLRPDGDSVLLVTSIAAFLTTGPVPPQEGDYARVLVGRCTPRLAIAGFGTSEIVAGGTRNEQLVLRPGAVVALPDATDSLCLRSLVQSTTDAVIQIHGVLRPK